MEAFYFIDTTVNRANDQDRTGDLILTMDVLYQLSYIGFYILPFASNFLTACCTAPTALSGRRGSNPPPIAWKAIALPNELLPLI